MKSLFGLVEVRNIQVRFDSMMWRSHVLQLHVNMASVKKTLVELKKDNVELNKKMTIKDGEIGELKKETIELRKDNVELRDILQLTENSNAIVELKTQMMGKDGEIMELKKDNATLKGKMSKLEEIIYEREALIFFREMARNVEKWIAYRMGKVKGGVDIIDLIGDNDREDRNSWVFIYRMHQAYLNNRMCAEDKRIYEESLKILLPPLTDYKTASIELYNHISPAKGDGNVFVHGKWTVDKMKSLAADYELFIDDPAFWKRLLDRYFEQL